MEAAPWEPVSLHTLVVVLGCWLLVATLPT